MITRLWRGCTTVNNADAYEGFLLGELFPSMREEIELRARAAPEFGDRRLYVSALPTIVDALDERAARTAADPA